MSELSGSYPDTELTLRFREATSGVEYGVRVFPLWGWTVMPTVEQFATTVFLNIEELIETEPGLPLSERPGDVVWLSQYGEPVAAP